MSKTRKDRSNDGFKKLRRIERPTRTGYSAELFQELIDEHTADTKELEDMLADLGMDDDPFDPFDADPDFDEQYLNESF